MHGDIHSYPVVPVEIRHGGKKHSVGAAVRFRLVHLLILGTGSFCVSPRGLRNTISRSSAPAHNLCKECGVGSVSGHLQRGDPKRDPN